MAIKIVMNNKNKFNLEGTLETWTEKIKSEEILQISPTICVMSKNISEVHEKVQKVSTKKK